MEIPRLKIAAISCKTSMVYILLLQLFLMLHWSKTAHTELVFLGQEPFRAYLSIASIQGQTIYQFYAVESRSRTSDAITYSITQNSEPPLFEVDPQSGQLLYSSGSLAFREYSLRVAAMSDSQSIETSMTVFVTFETDTAALFEHPTYNITVPEDLPVDAAFSVVRAFAPNLGTVAASSYTIIGGNADSDITIDTVTGLLRTNKELDRERTEMYTLVVRYISSSSPIETNVNVFVLDVNDNRPQFSMPFYNISISEMIAPGSTISSITANDPDFNENGTITYSLDPSASQTFFLDPNTGDLSVIASLDYERQPQYQFSVTATDSGMPPTSSTVVVLLNLMNIDDECPWFENPIFTSEVRFDMDTGVFPAIGMTLVTVKAYDPDRLNNISYSIESTISGSSGVLELDSMTGSITLSRVDPSIRGLYVLNVSASDESCSRQSFVPVEIGIGSRNSHSPRFETECTAMLLENPSIGTPVVTLTARDDDIGLNGMITYNLLTQTELFMIDPTSGTVMTVAEPGMYNRENQTQFFIDVIARDGGNRQDYCQLTVTLLDQNDNPPQILLQLYETTIYRDVPLETFVLQIEATDSDNGVNGTVYFFLEFLDEPPFAIDPESGVITTNGTLSDNMYVFDVVATDIGEPIQLSSTATVCITIANDMSFPIFNQTSYTGEERENIPFDTTVLTVIATSTSTNDPILYEIVSGSDYRSNVDSSVFRSNLLQGGGAEIRVGSAAVIDYERLQPSTSFSFYVRASNTAGSSIASVKITITDVDDNDPEFISDFSILLAEDEPIGTTVLHLQATDPDSGSNGEINYRLFFPSIFFSVMPGGTVVSNHTFDSENPSESLSGAIVVEAFNPISPNSVRTTERVIWMIVDVNDNQLSFTNFSYTARLPENQLIESVVLTLEANDPDSSNTNNLQYFITEGNDGTFEIRSNRLILASRLDFETTAGYRLAVEVTDGQHTGCTTCSAIVDIEVIDVDDEPPVFSQPVFQAEIVENAAVGTFVLNVSAADPDSDTVHFDLLGVAVGRFAVDTSGQITVSGNIDREDFLPDGELVFLVLAEGGSLATAEVRITITDMNDNAPRFIEAYRGRVHENISPGDEGINAVTVQAFDADAGRNGTVTYSLIDGEEAGFRINPNSGVITSHTVLDREAQPSYTITLQAEDNGAPVRLSSTTQVTIDVGDDNDNPPFFPFPFMFARVFENSPTGTHIITIPAIDVDNGTNATITYTLVSFTPSEEKFSLDSETGEVTVSGSLDYEVPLHRLYTLTVSIRDPRFQADSEGTLEIELLDQNDNAPIIDEPDYVLGGSSLPETLPFDEQAVVARVEATDEDSGFNSELVFEISSGDENNDFSISDEGGVGVIRNIRQLDRETTSRYQLTVTVSDKGSPPRSSTVDLIFRVLDVNDEAPVFLEPSYTVTVVENTNPQASILQVNATDPDSGSGGMIREYSIQSGNEGRWFTLNSTEGILGTEVMFDRENRSSYTLTITAVDDGGSVAQTGTVTVQVLIGDINDNPSLFGGVLYIHIYALDGQAPSGVIGVPNFNDSDVSNMFTACIVRFQSSEHINVFEISTSNCEISLHDPNPPEDIYNFQYRGRDGIHTSVNTNVTIEVSHVRSSDLPIDSLVTVTVNASAEEYFSKRLNVSFPLLIAGAIGIDESLVHVVSVQPGYHDPDRSVDVTFTARNPNSEFMNPTVVTNELFLQRHTLVSGNHGIASIPTDPCVSEPCLNQAACRSIQRIRPTELVARSKEFVLLAPRIELDYECGCVPGTAGSLCEINYDDCYSYPCMQNAQCFDGVDEFQCDCPDGSNGPDCGFNPDECINDPCMNGAMCFNGLNTYVCYCLPGYYGKECQYRYYHQSTVCSDNPCRNGATCSPGRDAFTCLCPEGFSGQFCDVVEPAQGGCLRNPCYNGSSCTDTPEGPVCTCSVGFTGPNCRWPLNNCELLPCENGGICQQGLYGSYRCICIPGFTGENCSTVISACDANPCQNGGRCLDQLNGTYVCECTRYFHGMNCGVPLLPSDLCSVPTQPCAPNANCTSGRDDFTCTCMPGFSGRDCSQAVNTTSSSLTPCHSNPCQHGSTCNDESDGTYSCMCSVGFTGDECQTNIDDCIGDPCLNGGVCLDGVDGFVCNCSAGNTGRLCEVFCPEGQVGEFCETKVQFCSEERCSNGGTCVEEHGSFRCICPPGYAGATCEGVYDCSTIQCLNGGVCVETNTGVDRCECEENFEGENCELLTISFSGSSLQSSYRAYNSLYIRGQGNISFEFATRERDGLLLYNTQYQGGESVDFIAAEVVGGVLRVSVSQGDDTALVSVMSSAVSVSDGQWHQVTIETSGQRVRVLLDFCQMFEEGLLTLADCTASNTTLGTKSFLDFGLPLWLGGVPSELSASSNPHISSQGITACIRRVYVGGELLDLQTHFMEENSAPGCADIEEVCLREPLCGDGECLPMLGGHRCVCPPQVAGDSCENAAEDLMFGGKTYAQYTLVSSALSNAGQRRKRMDDNQAVMRSSIGEQISLRFRTEMDNGLLFHMGNALTGDTIFIEVDDGSLVYNINLGSSTERVTLPLAFPVTDAQWHFFESSRVALDLSLTLDNMSFTHTLGGSQLNLDINTSQIFAGGRPSENGAIINPYIGCLQDIRLDQSVLPTSGANTFASVTFSGSAPISRQCALRGCFPNPCGNGNCTEQGETGYMCMCVDGSTLISQPCPEPIPSSSYALAIVAGCVAGALILLVVIVLLGMLCYMRQKKRKYVIDQREENAHRDIFGLEGRDCLVISNDPGGGEQDTSMTTDRFNEHYVNVPTRKQVNASPGSSEESLAKKPLDVENRLNAVLAERIAAANEEYTDVDSMREFCEEEGSDSELTILSSICGGLDNEVYTVERLQEAGPEFEIFVELLESVLAEEKDDYDSASSQVAHTGKTQDC